MRHDTARDDGQNNTVADPAASEKQDKERAEVFEYLDNLRLSGITNMFGAGPYIVARFDWRYTRDEARGLLKEWMASYEK